jgi:large subunit ribosomal protein L21
LELFWERRFQPGTEVFTGQYFPPCIAFFALHIGKEKAFFYLCSPIFKQMYAIVEIAGRQYRVEENQALIVNRLQANEGDKVEFDTVLLVSDKGNTKVGAPTVSGAKVTARVEQHGKGKKVIVFKKKRRKGYQKQNGHRDYLTRLHIESIKA